jgi:hypothetical protein
MSKTTPRTGIPVDKGASPFSSARNGTNTASDYSPPHSSGLRTVSNEASWGEAKSERFGGGTRHPDMGPVNSNKPQKLGDANNQQGNFYDNDCRESWKTGIGESATGKPYFDFNKPDGPPVGGNRDTPGRGPK